MRAHDEDILQRQCNAYLELLKAQGRIMYIHIPGSLQRFIWNKASHVPIHIAKEASNALKGIPDLLIFRRDGMSLKLELKSKTGTLTEGSGETSIPKFLDLWRRRITCSLSSGETSIPKFLD